MTEAGSGKISVTCACGARLGIPSSAAGKRVRCPKCDAVFTVPEVEEELGFTTAELEEAVAAADTSTKAASSSARCTECDAIMDAGAVLCVSCGHNSQTGKSLKAASARKADAVAGARRLVSGAGNFALGCALSGVGALLGAVAWSVVAVVTNFEIGWIAWGLGAAAGMGMSLGYKEKNLRAGMTAVVITLFGIVAAKGFTFAYFTYPEIKEASRHVSSIGAEGFEKFDRVAQFRADRKGRERGLGPNDSRRMDFYSTGFDAAVELPEESLSAELEEIDRWDAGVKWEDEKYVCAVVAYHMLNEFEKTSEESENPEPLDERGWRKKEQAEKKKYREFQAKVKALPPADRLAQAKEIEADQKHEQKASRLASHFAGLAADNEGLSPTNGRRFALQSELLPRYVAMSDAELVDGIRALEAWDAGEQWNDAEHVRNLLIYGLTREQMQEESGDDFDRSDWETSYEIPWLRHYATATERADLIPPDKHLELVKQRIVDEEQDAEDEIAAYRQEVQAELASDIVVVFFTASFNSFFDILFVVLAIGSAFKLATGSGEEA